MLFLIFINDLPLVLKDYVVVDLYADDTTFYDFQFDITQLETNLQHALNLLRISCRQNGMVLNTDKTKVMLITSRQKRLSLQNPVLSLTFSDIDIKMTHADNILGVHVDDNLMWNNHFQHVSKKISSYLWLLSKIKSNLSFEHRLLFYNAYIKPHFEYCSTVRSNTSSGNINKITKLQRRVCKLILFEDYTDFQEALKRLNILSFDQVIFLNKAKLMYKIYNNIAPVYLHELFQMRDINLDNTTSNLRSVAHKNYFPANKKRFWNIWVWLYEGLVELNGVGT